MTELPGVQRVVNKSGWRKKGKFAVIIFLGVSVDGLLRANDCRVAVLLKFERTRRLKTCNLACGCQRLSGIGRMCGPGQTAGNLGLVRRNEATIG
jgi:hypothetical protein